MSQTTAPTHADQSLLISADGYKRRSRELEALRTLARRELRERVRTARDDGDLADNPALQDLLEEQAQLDRRIALLEAQLDAATIVTPAENADDDASVGSVVRVRDGTGSMFEYELVGPLEADPGHGRVSVAAPVGRALIGARAGTRVEVTTPSGSLTFEVISVDAAHAGRT